MSLRTRESSGCKRTSKSLYGGGYMQLTCASVRDAGLWRYWPSVVRGLFSAALVLGFAAASWAATLGTVVPIRGHVSDIALDEGRGVVYAANFTANRIEIRKRQSCLWIEQVAKRWRLE